MLVWILWPLEKADLITLGALSTVARERVLSVLCNTLTAAARADPVSGRRGKQVQLPFYTVLASTSAIDSFRLLRKQCYFQVGSVSSFHASFLLLWLLSHKSTPLPLSYIAHPSTPFCPDLASKTSIVKDGILQFILEPLQHILYSQR